MKKKIIEEWYAIKGTLENVLTEARKTKRIGIAKRKVESKGYGGTIAGKAGYVSFKTKNELINYLTPIITQAGIDFEGFDEEEIE